jgi:hypothetical protein
MRKKTVTQQLKDELKENQLLHQQSMHLRRKAQSLIRETDAMFAPRLDLQFVFTCLFTIPRLGIAYAWRDKDSEPPRDFRRVHFLRGWSNEQINEVFAGGS